MLEQKTTFREYSEIQKERGLNRLATTDELLANSDPQQYYYNKLKQENSKYLNEDMYHVAVEKGDTDNFINLALMNSTNETGNSKFDVISKYGTRADYDEYVLAMQYPFLDNTEEKERGVDAEGNTLLYTDQAWAGLILDNARDRYDMEIEQEARDNMNWFEQIPAQLASYAGALAAGAVRFTQETYNLVEGIANIVAGKPFLEAFADDDREWLGRLSSALDDAVFEFQRDNTSIVQYDFETGRYERVGLGGMVHSMFDSIGYMLPSMLIGFATGGTSTALQASGKTAMKAIGKGLAAGRQALQTSVFYGGIFSGMVKENVELALEDNPGLSIRQLNAGQIVSNAAIKAAAQWAVEYALGKLLGVTLETSLVTGQTGSGILAKTTVDKAVKMANTGGWKAVGTYFGNRLKQAGQEGLEELLQDSSDAFIDYIYGSAGAGDSYVDRASETIGQVCESFVVGALTSIFTGSIANAKVYVGAQIKGTNYAYDANGKAYKMGPFQYLNQREAMNMLMDWVKTAEDTKVEPQERIDAYFKVNAFASLMGNVFKTLGFERSMNAMSKSERINSMHSAARQFEAENNSARGQILGVLNRSTDQSASTVKTETDRRQQFVDSLSDKINTLFAQLTLGQKIAGEQYDINKRQERLQKKFEKAKAKAQKAINDNADKLQKAGVTDIGSVITEDIIASADDNTDGAKAYQRAMKQLGVSMIIGIDGNIVSQSGDVMFASDSIIKTGKLGPALEQLSYQPAIKQFVSKLNKKQAQLVHDQYRQLTRNDRATVDEAVTALLFDKDFYCYMLLKFKETGNPKTLANNTALQLMATMDKVVDGPLSVEVTSGTLTANAYKMLMERIRGNMRSGLITFATQYFYIDFNTVSPEVISTKDIEAIKTVVESNKNVQYTTKINEIASKTSTATPETKSWYDQQIDTYADILGENVRSSLKRKATSSNYNDRVTAAATLNYLNAAFNKGDKAVYLPTYDSQHVISKNAQLACNIVAEKFGVKWTDIASAKASSFSNEIQKAASAAGYDLSNKQQRFAFVRKMIYDASNHMFTIGTNYTILQVMTKETVFTGKMFSDTTRDTDTIITEGITNGKIKTLSDLSSIFKSYCGNVNVRIDDSLKLNNETGYFNMKQNMIVLSGQNISDTLLHEATHVVQEISSPGIGNEFAIKGASSNFLKGIDSSIKQSLFDYINSEFPEFCNIVSAVLFDKDASEDAIGSTIVYLLLDGEAQAYSTTDIALDTLGFTLSPDGKRLYSPDGKKSWSLKGTKGITQQYGHAVVEWLRDWLLDRGVFHTPMALKVGRYGRDLFGEIDVSYRAVAIGRETSDMPLRGTSGKTLISEKDGKRIINRNLYSINLADVNTTFGGDRKLSNSVMYPSSVRELMDALANIEYSGIRKSLLENISSNETWLIMHPDSEYLWLGHLEDIADVDTPKVTDSVVHWTNLGSRIKSVAYSLFGLYFYSVEQNSDVLLYSHKREYYFQFLEEALNHMSTRPYLTAAKAFYRTDERNTFPKSVLENLNNLDAEYQSKLSTLLMLTKMRRDSDINDSAWNDGAWLESIEMTQMGLARLIREVLEYKGMINALEKVMAPLEPVHDYAAWSTDDFIRYAELGLFTDHLLEITDHLYETLPENSWRPQVLAIPQLDEDLNTSAIGTDRVLLKGADADYVVKIGDYRIMDDSTIRYARNDKFAIDPDRIQSIQLRSDKQTGRRLITKDRAEGSNLKYFIEAGKPLQLHSSVVNFVENTTNGFSKLPRLLRELIKPSDGSGATLSRADLVEYAATALRMNDYTYQRLAEDVFRNKEAAAIPYATMKTFEDQIQLLAAAGYALRAATGDVEIDGVPLKEWYKKNLTPDEILDLMKKIKELVDEDEHSQLTNKYAKGMEVASTVWTADGAETVSEYGDMLNVLFMRYYDGTFASLVKINNIGKKIAFMAQPKLVSASQERGASYDTDRADHSKTRKSGDGRYNWFENLRKADANYEQEVINEMSVDNNTSAALDDVDTQTKRNAIEDNINAQLEAAGRELANITDPDERNAKAQEIMKQYNKNIAALDEMSDEKVNEEYLKIVAGEALGQSGVGTVSLPELTKRKTPRERTSVATKRYASNQTRDNSLLHIATKITEIAGKITKATYKNLPSEVKMYFDQGKNGRIYFNENYRKLSVDQREQLIDTLREFYDRYKATKNLSEAQMGFRKRMSKVDTEYRKAKGIETKSVGPDNKDTDTTKKKTMREKVDIQYRVEIKERNFSFKSNRKSTPIVSQLLATQWSKERMSKVQGLSTNEKQNVSSAKEFFGQNAEALIGMTAQEAQATAEWFMNASMENVVATSDDYKTFEAVRVYFLGYVFSQSQTGKLFETMDANFKNRLETFLRAITTVGATRMAVWNNIQGLVNPAETMANAIRLDGVKLTDEEQSTLIKAVNNNDMDQVTKIQQNIIDRVKNEKISKKSFGKTISSVRAMSMLSSPLTWLRNQVSNFSLKRLNKISSKIGNSIFSGKTDTGQLKLLKGVKVDQKTGRVIGGDITAEIQNFINANFIDNKLYDTLLSDITKYNPSDITKKYKNADGTMDKTAIFADMVIKSLYGKYYNDNMFKSKAMNKTYSFIMKMLSDNNYVREAAIRYFGKILGDRNYDLSKGVTDTVMTDFASAVGLAMADYMHSDNFLNQFERIVAEKGDIAYTAYKLVLPFASASWNWFKAAVRYSPVGLARSIVKLARLESSIIKAKSDFAQGKSQVAPELTEYTIRRDLGSGIIGTIGLIFGMALAGLGFVKLEDEDYGTPKLRIGNIELDISDIFGTSSILVGAGLVKGIIDGDGWDGWVDGFNNALDIALDGFFLTDIMTLDLYSDGSFTTLANLAESVLLSFIPNFVSYAAGATYFGNKKKTKLWQKLVAKIPFLANVLPDKVDPYTGDTGGVLDMLSRVLPYLDINVKSNIEQVAESLGLSKAELTGRYTINDESFDLSAKETAELNKLYGSWNADYITQFLNDQLSVRLKDSTTNTYKELKYSQMTEAQRKSAISNIMNDNAKYAKIKAWVNAGNSYYGTDTEYQDLRKRGVAVYKGNKGFVKK